MRNYGCTACNKQFDTFEEALPHHNQITGHNICTPPIDCPSCAAHVAREKELEDKLDAQKDWWITQREGWKSRLALLEQEHAEWKEIIDDYAVRHGEMTRKVEMMERVASDLLEFAEEGWAYADDYFRRKWYYERVIELRAALDKLKEG